MSARVIKRMSLAKASILVFVLIALLTTFFMVRMSQGEAVPAGPTDATAVPHYFGPWPNWALSPTTETSATVTVVGTHDTTATATASVGGNGVITAITVTNSGSGYTPGTATTVDISGAGSGAAATAVVTSSGTVTGITVGATGAAYKQPVVAITGGGATTAASATAYGSVDNVNLANAGSGYTFPTVDFDMPDDPAGTQATAHATWDVGTGAITGIVIDNPGSGYASAPHLIIRDGTVMDPINNGGAGASATATINVIAIGLDTFGAGYTSVPSVTIFDQVGTGSGATATAAIATGGVTAINITNGGTGYVTGSGIKKFQDPLPGLCNPAVPGSCPADWGNALTPISQMTKAIPLGVPVETIYNKPNGQPMKSDQYEIGLVQYRTNFSSSMPAGALVRGYVQLETPEFVQAHPGVSVHYPLSNEWADGTIVPILKANGARWFAVTPPQWLGPTIAATKDKAVRIVFRNLLPNGAAGDLFLPVDPSIMGSGMGPSMNVPDPVDQGTVTDSVRNPYCADVPKPVDCFKDNRATLHLHGGTTPWISDGTPHQWITPANEDTPWPQGVSVQNVPDMTGYDNARDGVQTFYYTNQQSARLMFYHDHAWGITRLNVYAGEAAGYLIGDDTEAKLVASGTIPDAAATIPLVVQDRTFVPSDSVMYDQRDAGGNIISYGADPTWNKARWGGEGSLWYHHVYMPAQNPGDPSGMSAYGRWMYGPWFWPPAAATVYGPIDNPYYDPACNLNDPATWTYQTDPFCEPQKIPGTPNISAGMEQFNDTPVVNGVAYPKVTLQPKTYRFRVLNAANDRFFNFQWYVADPSTGTLSEVALDPLLLAAAQTDPVVFPTPVHNASTAGPDWIQIGSEGGFLPAPVVVNGQQETTWITDPTRFDVGNVDLHSLLLAPAERADVIVDFSAFAGKTLILYNDAPAAFPARVPSYDYYTGAPDMSPNGAKQIIPGYGPNTRTVMQVTIAGTPAPAFNLPKLKNAFLHKADGSGVFESAQHPIIVGQAAYNSAYGTSFSGASNCNEIGSTLQICDGFVRINDTQIFSFNTLKKPTTKTTLPLQPKAIHDEMNATTFDEFGRMQANLGVEAQPPTPGLQNVTLYPYVNPSTELVDGTNLPKQTITYDANGNAVSDVKITPIVNPDGSQLWRITHNGVDTHPIHFHLWDVQLLNRVTWDNIVIPPDPEELGWKETVRMAPLEDTIVALRPIIPDLPWEVPNAIRDMNPMDPTGSTKLFNNIDPQGNPSAPIVNQLVNFGWEYVYHCHILSHEEMDMMRPVDVVMPPVAPSGLANTFTGTGTTQRANLSWSDNSITETSFVLQRSTDLGATWTNVGTITQPLDQSNVHQTRAMIDTSTFDPATQTRYYRVLALNEVGYGNGFPAMTAQSASTTLVLGPAFTITSSTGANGTIAPLGAVSVGPGGSQVFTVTPDPGYRVNQVLVDAAPATLVNGTYTFTNVQANHTISVTFTQAAATITATSGAGGSVTPPGVQTVAVGGSQTYTITPNNGYQVTTVLVDGVNDPAAVASGTYTFTGVIANHTIAATFALAPPVITVTVPPAGGTSWPSGTTQSLGWTLASPAAVGQFGVWLVDQADATKWYGAGFYDVVPGAVSYAPTFSTLGIPTGTYVAVVYYRPDPTVWTWTANAISPGAATITAAAFSIQVTVPPAGGVTWQSGSTQTLGWGVTSAVGAGQFGVWLVDQADGSKWYSVGFYDAIPGALTYSPSSSLLGVPAGTYSVVVYYRPDPTQWVWTASGTSPGAATVTPPGLIVTVTVPPVGGAAWTVGSTQTLGWTVDAAVSVGEFGVWFVDQVDPTQWYMVGLVSAIPGALTYSPSVSLAGIPAGTYKAIVYYRPDPTQWVWTANGTSPGTALIQ